MTTLLECLLAGDGQSDLSYRLVDEVIPAQWPALLELAGHPDPIVRRDLVSSLPLFGPDPPPQELVRTAVDLTRDADIGVRDAACFALGTLWREVDTTELREALAARLDDLDRDTRSEALLGLAFRRDPRALPRVRAALSRASGDVWKLELLAAGALGDPVLHPFVLRHLDGWDDDDRLEVDAVRRLTDPAGPGADVFRRTATLYADLAAGRPESERDLPGWQLMDLMLDIAPDRTHAFFTATAARLSEDPAALARFTGVFGPARPSPRPENQRPDRRDP